MLDKNLTVVLPALLFAGLLVGCDGNSNSPEDGDTDGTSDTIDEDASGCEGCYVAGECRDDGWSDPSDPCFVCDVSISTTSLSPDDGASCDDNRYCNGADTCLDGYCIDHEGDPCGDDGEFCNGTEFCDEVIDMCFHTDDACPDDGIYCNGAETCDEDSDTCGNEGDPCGDDTCYEAEDRCCSAASIIDCNAYGDVALFDSCGHEEALIEDCTEAPDALCLDGVCGCLPGWTGESCDQCVRFVDWEFGGDENLGTSWTSALQTVDAGIAEGARTGCHVWIKAGTYTPGDGSDRNAQFVLLDDVELYGGFSGSENSPKARDFELNPTIFSGDIGTVGDSSDNSYRILEWADGAVLDGFTVRDSVNTALRAQETYVTVRNCLFENNAAGIRTEYFGATVIDSVFMNNEGTAVRVYQNWEGPEVDTLISGCVFENNSTTFAGAGLQLMLQEPTGDVTMTVENCVFISNTSTGTSYGGGGAWLHLEDWSGTQPGTLVVNNSTFVDNSSGLSGGGLNVSLQSPGSTLEIHNCIFWDNSADTGPQIHIDNTMSTPNIFLTHNDVQDAGYDGTDGNISLAPGFVQGDPLAGPLDLHLTGSSPCIDAGDDTMAPEMDIEGLDRFDDPLTDNCPLAGEPDCDWVSDMGAHEFQG